MLVGTGFTNLPSTILAGGKILEVRSVLPRIADITQGAKPHLDVENMRRVHRGHNLDTDGPQVEAANGIACCR